MHRLKTSATSSVCSTKLRSLMWAHDETLGGTRWMDMIGESEEG